MADTSNEEEEPSVFLIIHLTFNELLVIYHIISGYTRFMRNIGVPFTVHDGLCTSIRQKITVCLASGKEVETTLFTEEELRLIVMAFRGFLQVVHTIIPQSQERDRIIEGAENLRVRIERILPPDGVT